MAGFAIDGREIGEGRPAYVIAEIGANHNGDFDTACKMIREAKRAGADAVKLQSFLADQLVTRDHPEYESLKQTEMPRAWYAPLLEAAREAGITLFSTATNEITLAWMEEDGFPCYKIASGNITHLPLIRKVARLGKPLIVSTGSAGMGEIERAVETIRAEGNDAIMLLHCVSNYPAEPGEINLRFMKTMRRAFGCPVGYSDHTIGTAVPLAAVAAGASAVEKHFTLDKNAEGDDHVLSLEPDELARLIADIRIAEEALGSGVKVIGEKEKKGTLLSRRTLHAARVIPEGTTITEEMLSILRPADGLSPDMLDFVIGRVAKRKIEEQEPITWGDL
ncbi:MAG: N-acetylneuraminate synthase family protein [bacterium]|nr:N-acetylneuraminate synthase family protein [bacterium]